MVSRKLAHSEPVNVAELLNRIKKFIRNYDYVKSKNEIDNEVK